jgi:hypothetical protein
VPKQFADFESINLRKHQVKHNQAWRRGSRFSDCFSAVGSGNDVITGLLQIELNEFHRFRFIINHEDFLFHGASV